MGNKVSTKMAAPTSRVIQTVRPHAPMIKFPNRQSLPKPNALEALKSSVNSLPQHNTVGSPSAAATSRPDLHPSPILGSPDTLASIQLLPARYRRRLLTADEMEYIQRGGPE